MKITATLWKKRIFPTYNNIITANDLESDFSLPSPHLDKPIPLSLCNHGQLLLLEQSVKRQSIIGTLLPCLFYYTQMCILSIHCLLIFFLST